MKMTWHRQNSSPLFLIIARSGGALAIAAALYLLAPPMPVVLQGIGQQVAAPLWRARDSLMGVVYGAVTILETKEALTAENNRLYETISTLRREAFEGVVLKEENKRLQELLNRKTATTTIAASVLSRPGASIYDTMVVDVGENHHITTGSLVLVEGATAIGYVEQVGPVSSTVTLFSTPGLETPVIVGVATPTPAVALGWGGGNFMVRLPRDTIVEVGDPVVLPTFSPRVFATVASIVRDPTDSFQELQFRVPINLATVRHVLIDTAVSFDPRAYVSSEKSLQR